MSKQEVIVDVGLACKGCGAVYRKPYPYAGGEKNPTQKALMAWAAPIVVKDYTCNDCLAADNPVEDIPEPEKVSMLDLDEYKVENSRKRRNTKEEMKSKVA